jgi:hypothetical protein
MKKDDDDDQTDKEDIDPNLQSDDQDQDDKTDDDGDDFEPKLTAKEYAKKWRDASAEAAKTRKELAKIKGEKERQAKAQLKEQGKYKEMYESKEAEHTKLKGFLEGAARSQAFKAAAVREGCDPDLVELLEKSAELAEIELDEKYRPDMDQVKFEVERLREKYGKFFKKDVRSPKDGAPKKPDAALTHETWLTLPLEERKNKLSEVVKADSEAS